MAVVKRPTPRSSGGVSSAGGPKTLLATIFVVLFVGIVYIALPSDNAEKDEAKQLFQQLPQEAGKLRMSVAAKKEQLREALAESLGQHVSQHLPTRLRRARDRHEIVGDRLEDIKAGRETVQELLYGERPLVNEDALGGSDQPPMELHEIIEYLSNWIHLLHDTLGQYKNANYEQIWQGYHDLTVKTLYPWDREYLKRMPQRRPDGSIFLSVATYRDENCLNTLTQALCQCGQSGLFICGISSTKL
jgi:hypothetical protein